VPPGDDERVHATVIALKETVCLLKNDGRTALGALVLDGYGKTQWSAAPTPDKPEIPNHKYQIPNKSQHAAHTPR